MRLCAPLSIDSEQPFVREFGMQIVCVVSNSIPKASFWIFFILRKQEASLYVYFWLWIFLIMHFNTEIEKLEPNKLR